MGTWTDVAVQGAGLTLFWGDLMGIVRARNLARATERNIKQNLFFAFADNPLVFLWQRGCFILSLAHFCHL